LSSVAKVHHKIHLTADFANLAVLDDFISACPFFDVTEKNRALLITTEIFDNIVTHSKGFKFVKVGITLKKTDTAEIHIKYLTRNFDKLIHAFAGTSPHFDTVYNRYRGLGLRMCENLSSTINYRKGLFKSSIIIIL